MAFALGLEIVIDRRSPWHIARTLALGDKSVFRLQEASVLGLLGRSGRDSRWFNSLSPALLIYG